MKVSGRPLKYSECLNKLDNDTLYSPAKIAQLSIEQGIYNPNKDQERVRDRMRNTLARLAKNHGFPELGDAIIKLPKQGPTVAYFGRRWKSVLIEKQALAAKPASEAPLLT